MLQQNSSLPKGLDQGPGPREENGPEPYAMRATENENGLPEKPELLSENSRTLTTITELTPSPMGSCPLAAGLRLPSCDRWHPDTVSDVYGIPERGRNGRSPYIRRLCRICRKTRPRIDKDAHSYKDDGRYRARTAIPYGVLPSCSWGDPFGALVADNRPSSQFV